MGVHVKKETFNTGWTAAHLAAGSGHVEVLRALKGFGCSMNAETRADSRDELANLQTCSLYRELEHLEVLRSFTKHGREYVCEMPICIEFRMRVHVENVWFLHRQGVELLAGAS